jgi:hypothetical protein
VRDAIEGVGHGGSDGERVILTTPIILIPFFGFAPLIHPVGGAKRGVVSCY